MDSFDINRKNWDERAPIHAASPEYALDRFRADPDYISDVVRFDLPRLPDVRGLRGVHLQCHIGTDTLSLSRLGATMTGLDFSAESLAVARALAADTGDPVDFVEADVYSATSVLPAGGFDLVFTGIGALCWLPRIDLWADVVRDLLRPGGRLFLREGHPVLWALDYDVTDRLVIDYPYFETEQPLEEAEETSYVQAEHRLRNAVTHTWNHGIGEVVTALLDRGFTITALEEHASVPWDPIPTLTVKSGPEWVLAERRERLPLTYTLQAVRSQAQ